MRRLGPGRLLLAILVTFGVLVLTPSPSWACSCAVATTAAHVKDAGTVAVGKVNWTATDGQVRTYQVGFDVVYKGAAARTEKLRTNASEAACGVGDLAVGKRYLFFIQGKHPGAMEINLCGGTTAYDDRIAGQVAAITGGPEKPLPAPAPTGRPDNPDHTTLVVSLGALVLLLCLATGVAASRR